MPAEGWRSIETIRRPELTSTLVLERWLARVHEGFADRVLPVDRAIAERWGALHVPDPVPTVDGLLAATALVHDLTLVTRNVRDVERTGVREGISQREGRAFPRYNLRRQVEDVVILGSGARDGRVGLGLRGGCATGRGRG